MRTRIAGGFVFRIGLFLLKRNSPMLNRLKSITKGIRPFLTERGIPLCLVICSKNHLVFLPSLHIIFAFFDKAHLVEIFGMLFILAVENGLVIAFIGQLTELVLTDGIIAISGDRVIQQDLQCVL